MLVPWLLCFIGVCVLAGEKGPVHSRSDSPLNCSRAVSRWVRQALEKAVWKPSQDVLGKTYDVPPSCPWYYANDLFHLHALNKRRLDTKGRPIAATAGSQVNGYKMPGVSKKKAGSGPVNHQLHMAGGRWQCGVCGKHFRTEISLDNHIELAHMVHIVHKGAHESPGVMTTDDGLEPGEVSVAREVSQEIKAQAGVPLHIPETAVCLEHHCAIFDVCEHPTNPHKALLKNDLAVIPSDGSPLAKLDAEDLMRAEAADAEGFAAASAVDVPEELLRCDMKKLLSAYLKCREAVESCFPLSGSKQVRAFHIELRENLCDALKTCEHYVTRRRYSGTRSHYRLDAFSGNAGFLAHLLGWQLALIIFGITLFVVVVLVACLCMIDVHQEVRRENQVRNREKQAGGGTTFRDMALETQGARRRRHNFDD